MRLEGFGGIKSKPTHKSTHVVLRWNGNVNKHWNGMRNGSPRQVSGNTAIF